MKHRKASARVLAAILAVSLMLSLNAFAVQTGTAESQGTSVRLDSSTELFLALSEGTTESLAFPLTEAQAAQVREAGADRVTWTLHRLAPYANPADGRFNPIHGEEKLFPYEKETIDFATITYGAAHDDFTPFSMERFETSLDGATLTLNFTTTPAISSDKESLPHESGGDYLDICGRFSLTAELDGTTLATLENVTIKPYASFHTMWEIYDELLRLAEEGDDSSVTPAPYVEYGVMGQSCSGYDMPYLIIARDRHSVEKWLDLAEKAEENGTAVIEELHRSGDDDYQVPILYSNIHSNEIAAVDGVLEFARLLIEEPSIDYTKLTGLTAEGQARVQAQRAAVNMSISELVAEMTGYLGSIRPFDESLDSGKVEEFDSYYTAEETTLTVADLLNDVFFIIVPEENVEGRIYDTRTSSGGYDLNRDNAFQTMPETRNMQRLIAVYDPVTQVELHGQDTEFLVEPCTPPHEPNLEYDLLAKHLMTGGEAFGAAAVANNPDYQSYIIPMRDYLFTYENDDVFWGAIWDDMSIGYTPQFAMLHGCVGYTIELPAYSESARQAATFGLLGLSDYVAANKESYFTNLAEIYGRCAENRNTDDEVGPWLVDIWNNSGGEAQLFRPAHAGEGENGQFFPECYLIPLDGAHQTNLQAAFEMIEWLTRNDVTVGVASSPVTADGQTLPAGTAVVSMYQAKRAVANGALFDGTFICNWFDLYAEAITAFSHTRGFDMVTCTKPAEYSVIAGAVGRTLTYDTVQGFLEENAVSQFAGEKGWDVIISNASEDSVAAVNALLRAGRQVGMITEGAYKGDFICSYADWQTVASAYLLTGTGVRRPSFPAYAIGKSPVVYISGTRRALTPSDAGYVYTTLVSDAYEYNYDRVALDQMGFATTEDAAQADAVLGANALEAEGLAAVQSGVPYVGYTFTAFMPVLESLLPDLQYGWTGGLDCLGYVTYPEETLVNASYILDGDDVFYGYGRCYFTALPEGAKVLVQRDGSREPLEGFLNGGEESKNAFLNGIMGFSYAGPDKDGNNVNITLFANSLTNKAHQRDEYAFISNALFASLLTETPYVTAAGVSGGSSGGSSAAANPISVSGSTASATIHGSVKVSAANAKAGNTVILTPEPDEGYVTTGVTVTDAKGNNVPVTKNADGTYSFTMPDTAVTVTPTFVKEGEVPASGDVSDRFTDVSKTAWYHDAVQWAVDKGLMNGVSESLFAPNDTCTRAMVVTMLWRLAGEPAASSASGFADVSGDAWYANAVNWAAENGAVKGTSDTAFSPNAPVTREQLAAILYRYAQAQGKGFTGSWAFPLDYPDADQVSEYANEAMHWMTIHGVITGMDDGTLAPKDNATRAQIATMFMRFCEALEA